MLILAVVALAILALLLIGAILAAIAWFIRVIVVALTRLAIAGGAATIVGLGVALIADHRNGWDPVATGTLTGLGALPFAMVAVGRWHPRTRALPSPLESTWSGTPSGTADVLSCPRPTLEQAWGETRHLIPTAVHRIAAAKCACDALLTRAAVGPPDWAVTDWAQVITARVPEHVALAAHLERLNPRSGAADALIDDLDLIAAEARVRLALVDGLSSPHRVVRFNS